MMIGWDVVIIMSVLEHFFDHVVLWILREPSRDGIIRSSQVWILEFLIQLIWIIQIFKRSMVTLWTRYGLISLNLFIIHPPFMFSHHITLPSPQLVFLVNLLLQHLPILLLPLSFKFLLLTPLKFISFCVLSDYLAIVIIDTLLCLFLLELLVHLVIEHLLLKSLWIKPFLTFLIVSLHFFRHLYL